MWEEKDAIPPGLLEAIIALTDGEDAPEGAVVFVVRPDPREQLVLALREALQRGRKFFDLWGARLDSPEEIIAALKADGRVQVSDTVELDPELAPYL